MNIKRTLIIPAVLSSILFTGCGSKNDMAFTAESPINLVQGDAKGDNLNYDSAAENYMDSEDYDGSENYDDSATPLSDKKNNTAEEVVKKEMLVYTCNMTVDVLDFNSAINAFRSSLDEYGAFVENENYSDGGSGGRWQYSNAEKWQTYTATVRVPSEVYDDFCSSTSDLGDLRSKNAKVDNLSAEYYDLSTTLEIYEAKEKRYLDLLDEIKDEQYAISIEEQLTDIQIQISRLKTRMKDIRTDVAYSYVYVTINEVKEYHAEPVKTDTFFQRLKNTVANATEGFLDFMEGLLFVMIYVFPYAAIIALIVFIIVKLCKLSIKRSKAKKLTATAVQPAQQVQPVQPIQSEPEKKSDKNDKQK